MNAQQAIDIARGRLRKLASVSTLCFPLDVPSTGRHDDWGVTGPAFVARATRLVQALVEISNDHEFAAGVLARVLYEHVTIFTWLAIEPAKHLPQWVRRDRAERLKIDADLAAFGRPLLPPSTKAAFEGERDAIPDRWPGLAGMAQQADLYWETRIKEFSTDVYGLRGMYGIMYRPFSALVHGMSESLQRIVQDGPGPGVSRVSLVEDTAENNAFTAAPFMFALGLLVSHECHGFPTRESIHGSC